MIIDPCTVLNLKFTDSDGNHNSKCNLLGYGWSLDRRPIYYELEVLESDSIKYNVGAQFILPFEFNGKDTKFIFKPNVSGHGCYSENHYEAKIDIINEIPKEL
jgi:hypothetical protein